MRRNKAKIYLFLNFLNIRLIEIYGRFSARAENIENSTNLDFEIFYDFGRL
jgi:hypothetical protein